MNLEDTASTTTRSPESDGRWELRSLIAMAICSTPNISLTLDARPSVCICKRDYRRVDPAIPRCLDCLGKADAALRLLDLLEQQRKPHEQI